MSMEAYGIMISRFFSNPIKVELLPTPGPPVKIYLFIEYKLQKKQIKIIV